RHMPVKSRPPRSGARVSPRFCGLWSVRSSFESCRLRPGFTDFAQRGARIANSSDRKRSNHCFVTVANQVLDGRLAIDAPEHQRRQQARSTRFERLARFPAHTLEVTAGKDVEAFEIPSSERWHPEALE